VLDQDDVFLPSRLQILGAVLSAHSEASFAFSAAGCSGDHGWLGSARFQSAAVLRRLRSEGQCRTGCHLIDGRLAAAVLMVHGDYVVGYPGFLFRRVDWQRKGGLDESLRVGSDYDLLCWLCLRGSAAFVPRTLYLRRVHTSNLSRARTATAADCLQVARRYCDQIGALPTQARHWLRCLFLRRLTILSWEGAHHEAARLFWACTSDWGWIRDTPWTAAKLLLLWAGQSILRRVDSVSSERVALWKAFLETVRGIAESDTSLPKVCADSKRLLLPNRKAAKGKGQ
jgi:hypothetical protein